ncbi:hypothetical protein BC936DRAFT_140735 [Jimgerdemannia flammicorona]|uniref:Uncharacterized protein n=1 Tax=Jimgerdemannia flammicorona TaxID=994334 RepID=A0A433DGS6_9FUNG|nr:hypothetical protein BC936DRAFT_140735 [Jimgerdemannia flammicorona]
MSEVTTDDTGPIPRFRRPSLSTHPSERNDPKDWPLPNTPKAIVIHALKGGASTLHVYSRVFFFSFFLYVYTRSTIALHSLTWFSHLSLWASPGSFILAYGVRAGVTLCLGILRVFRRRSTLVHAFVAAFKGTDSVRFGAMFGIFSLLWKFINNSLRYGRGVDDRLNGFIAGLSLRTCDDYVISHAAHHVFYCECGASSGNTRTAGRHCTTDVRSVRSANLIILNFPITRNTTVTRAFTFTYTQSTTTSALQATYSAGKSREMIDFKHGDALLFALTSAQVLYAYTMQPHTLPPDFYHFMVHTARVPKGSLELNCENIRGFPLDVNRALNTISRLHPTPHALKVVNSLPLYPSLVPW